MVRLSSPSDNIGRVDIPREQRFNIIDKQGESIGPFTPFPGPKHISRCETGIWWPMEPREKWILRINECIHACRMMLGWDCGNSSDPMFRLTLTLRIRQVWWRRLPVHRSLVSSRDAKRIREWLKELEEWRNAYYRQFPDDWNRFDLRSCCPSHF
jgi:hypothetical protein